MKRTAFSRPKGRTEVRGKVAKRKFRNRFTKIFHSIEFFKNLRNFLSGSFVFWGCFGLMVIFVVFATSSPYFDIKKINIERNEAFVDIQAVQDVLEEFYGQNLLFTKHEDISAILRESFPDFRTIDIQENWPNEITLKIEVSPPVFNIFNSETANFSVMSEDGVILETQSDELLPVLRIFQYEPILVARKKFMDKETIEKILFARALLTKDLKLQEEALHYLYSANEFHFIFRNGSAIWIDLSQNIESQVRKLDLAADKIGLYRRSFDHIDLRIPNQIFWK